MTAAAKKSGARAVSSRKALLDSVLKQVQSLEKELPPTDRTRLDQYMTDVGKIERRIQRASAQKTTMSNLLLAMLDKFGIRLEKFGDSTAMLEI